jgi:hypothetical protein
LLNIKDAMQVQALPILPASRVGRKHKTKCKAKQITGCVKKMMLATFKKEGKQDTLL